MPTYHFHFENGHACPDLDGTELEDDEAAQVAAVQFLSELLRDRTSSFWETRSLRITVSDPSGSALFLLHVGVTEPTAAGRLSTVGRGGG